MLDQTTKHKIDSARQILVGKVPDPKAQVEQITTALIYKFMDDMDKESIELGGKANFFTDGFSQYAWTKLLDKKLSGQGRLDLYVQALTNIPKNPSIPQLFRDIFKGAFLPFRDPRTLTLFLKEINEFKYDNSENLGNAFEYLLSIMGSQGDAGQFRTPRHIIDFIVEAVDPNKNDTILDPACGTAGFLISAYKHILHKHDGRDDVTGKPTDEEKQLTPTEKTKMMNNFVGYDISPDMVKLSLVNLYLHGFPEPKIQEYDTLSDEKRWDETYDVILANPPFMTPKGGIRPHKRFSIRANRAEVLFVDYIAEHLNINGRAGIIVPEGIIFQSSNAYKSLRKNLIENWGLYAVVSMPAGIFQPYSGVKTSILLLDKGLSKKTDEILFVKVESDGFGLGAQRRKIDKDDLPKALEVLKIWGKTQRVKEGTVIAHVVKKKKIAESGDYNLTGERYRETVSYDNVEWEMVPLSELLDYEQPTNYIVNSTKYSDDYKTPVLTAGKSFILGYTNEKTGIFPSEKLPVTIFDDFTTVMKFVNFPFKVKSSAMKILIAKKDRIDPKFAYHMMKNVKLDSSRHKRYWISQYSKKKIPLPPLDIQKQIVAELDGYQKIINGAKQVVKNWKPSIKIDPEWEVVELGEVCEINPKKAEVKDLSPETKVTFLPMTDLNENRMRVNPFQEKPLSDVYKGYTYFKENDVLLARVTPCFENGKAGVARNLVNKIGFGSSEYLVLRPSEKILPELIYCFIKSSSFHDQGVKQMTGTGGLQRLSKQFVELFKISLPPLKTQKQIIAKIEEEQRLVKSNKKLIKIYQKKIKDRIDEMWGEK